MRKRTACLLAFSFFKALLQALRSWIDIAAACCLGEALGFAETAGAGLGGRALSLLERVESEGRVGCANETPFLTGGSGGGIEMAGALGESRVGVPGSLSLVDDEVVCSLDASGPRSVLTLIR